MNLLTETVTKIGFGDGMNSIWTGLGNAMGKVKDAVYGILPQLMTFLGDACSIPVVYHTHFVDCKKTRKNNKIYNLKYKNIIKNDIYK